MSLFSNLAVGSQALLSFQKGISSVNKNMTNVSTDGYKREIPIFSNLPNGGVNFSEAKRVYDNRLLNRMIDTNQEKSYYQELNSNLQEVEKTFSDTTGTGFSDALNDFFDSMNDIITAPDNLAARDSFLSKAQTLVGRIRDSYETLNNIKTTNSQSIQDSINKLNDKLHTLAKINRSIKTNQNDQETLNSLLNKRDVLLQDTSSLIDTKVRFNSDHTVDLFSAKGHALVLYDKNFKVEYRTGETTKDPDTLSHVFINGVDLTDNFKSGKIGAKIETEKKIDELIKRLNTFTSNFANEVNSVQTNGYDLNLKKGKNLFKNENINDDSKDASNIDASNIKLKFLDPEKVAASDNKDDKNELHSNNNNIKKMQDLKNKTFSNLNNQSFNEYYISSIVTKIGSDTNHINNLFEEKSALFDTLKEKLDNLSGVNMDEELIELTQLQKSYQASARVITVTNEMLDTVMGLVK